VKEMKKMARFFLDSKVKPSRDDVGRWVVAQIMVVLRGGGSSASSPAGSDEEASRASSLSSFLSYVGGASMGIRPHHLTPPIVAKCHIDEKYH